MTSAANSSPSPLRRLKVRAEFLRAAKGQRASRPGVLVQCIDRPEFNDLGAGFTASRKVGNAVIRNRARRRLKEAVRQLLPALGVTGRDYVFVARQATAEREWTLLLEDVRSALTSLARPSNGAPKSAPGRPRPGSAPAI